MGFKVQFIGGFNPFEWEAFTCPVCRKKEFVSHSHTIVYCDCCGAKFSVRMTSGDPGCVVDCVADKVLGIFAPAYVCNGCEAKIGLFDFEDKICPDCESRDLKRKEMLLNEWSGIEGSPTSYYLILKTGDYCSGWIAGNLKDHDRLDFPTQQQWEAFQGQIEAESGLGVSVHARCVEVSG